MRATPEFKGDGTPEWNGDGTPEWDGDGTPDLTNDAAETFPNGSFALVKKEQIVVKILNSASEIGSETSYLCQFTFPQFREETICKFFLNDKCSKQHCAYSHGFQVQQSDLEAYTLPTDLQVGEDVLAKDDGGLWYRAVLKRTTDSSRTVEFKRKKGINITLKPHSVTRLLRARDSKRKRKTRFDQMGEERIRKKAKQIVSEPVNTPGEFGSWHSGGFGLKSLMKYGYKPGTGLGKDQEGRVEPIPVKKLKRNVGLDYASAKIIPKKRRRKALPIIPPEEPKTFEFLNRHDSKVQKERSNKPKPKKVIKLEDKATLRKANETMISLQKNSRSLSKTDHSFAIFQGFRPCNTV